MTPVTCASCGARVLARKNSWEQTSVQWNGDSAGRCHERRRQAEQCSPTSIGGTILRPGTFLVCPMLRASIEEAATKGSLPILDEL